MYSVQLQLVTVMTLACVNIGTLTRWYLVFGARASAGTVDEVTGTGWRHTKKLTRLSCGFLSVSWKLLLSSHCSFILLYLMESSRISCWVSQKLIKYKRSHFYVTLTILTCCYVCIAILELQFIWPCNASFVYLHDETDFPLLIVFTIVKQGSRTVFGTSVSFWLSITSITQKIPMDFMKFW